MIWVRGNSGSRKFPTRARGGGEQDEQSLSDRRGDMKTIHGSMAPCGEAGKDRRCLDSVLSGQAGYLS